jgi:glycosyltransferase involved in cell wall biosynthesis
MLCDRPTAHSGGVERYQSLLARWFAARGYETSFVTWDEGQEDGTVVSGVRVLKVCRSEDGLPGLRFLHPRWTSLVRALARARADIYFYASSDMRLGQIAMWCRWARKAPVASVLNHWALDPAVHRQRPMRERVLYAHGLRGADRVIVQTREQERMLRDGFGVQPVTIPMPCEAPVHAWSLPGSPNAGPPRVVWVGRLSRVKRLEWLLDTAERCPEMTFDVVGAPNVETPYSRDLVDRAMRIPNVVMHGRIADRAELTAMYRRAAVLCCTSTSEGFPNTFLEAWSVGLPVVSTFDPDGIVADQGLGAVADTLDGLVAGIRTLVASVELRCVASAKAHRYYADNHAVERALPRVEAVLLGLHVERREGRRVGQWNPR